MKYYRCAECELNFVEKEGDICEICRGEDSGFEDENGGVCAVCGEECDILYEGCICAECRRELSKESDEEEIESKIFDNFFL